MLLIIFSEAFLSIQNYKHIAYKRIVGILTFEGASTSPALLRYHPECPPVDDPNLFRERKFPRKLKKQISLQLEAMKKAADDSGAC